MSHLENRVAHLEATVEGLVRRLTALEGGKAAPVAKVLPKSPTRTPVRTIPGRLDAKSPPGSSRPPTRAPVSTAAPAAAKIAARLQKSLDDNKTKTKKKLELYYVAGHKLNVERPTVWKEAKSDPAPAAHELNMEAVYGFNGKLCRQNLFWNEDATELVYNVAGAGIITNPADFSQRFFLGHSEDVTCLALHPTKEFAATGQRDPKGSGTPFICVWETKTMKKLVQITFHDRAVAAVAFSPDGSRLITVGDEEQRTGAVWDWKAEMKKKDVARAPLAKFSVSKDKVFGVRCPDVGSGDSFHMVSWGEKQVKFWKFEPAKVKTSKSPYDVVSNQASAFQQTKVIQKKYHAAVWLADGNCALGCDTGDVYIFSADAKFIRAIPALSKPATALCATEDGFFVGGGGLVKKFSLEYKKKDFKENAVFSAFPSDKKHVAQSLDFKNGLLAIGTADSRVFVVPYSAEAGFGQAEQVTAGHVDEIKAVASHPTRPIVATAGWDRTVLLYNRATRRNVGEYVLKKKIFSLEYDLTGDRLAVGLQDGYISIIQEGVVYGPFHVGKEQINVMRWTSDGSRLVAGCDDNTAYVLDASTYKTLRMLRGHTSAISHLTLSEDGKYAMTNSRDYEILFWDLNTSTPKTNIDGDVVWQGWHNILGWPVQGIFCNAGDGTDVNCAELAGVRYDDLLKGHTGVILSGDDFGNVNLFAAPSLSKKPQVKEYKGHSAHVFALTTAGAQRVVLTVGGGDLALIQWGLSGPGIPEEAEVFSEEDLAGPVHGAAQNGHHPSEEAAPEEEFPQEEAPAHEEVAHEEVAHEEVAQEEVAQEEVAHEEVAHEEVAQEEVAQEEAQQEEEQPQEEQPQEEQAAEEQEAHVDNGEEVNEGGDPFTEA